MTMMMNMTPMLYGGAMDSWLTRTVLYKQILLVCSTSSAVNCIEMDLALFISTVNHLHYS